MFTRSNVCEYGVSRGFGVTARSALLVVQVRVIPAVMLAARVAAVDAVVTAVALCGDSGVSWSALSVWDTSMCLAGVQQQLSCSVVQSVFTPVTPD